MKRLKNLIVLECYRKSPDGLFLVIVEFLDLIFDKRLY